MGRYADYDCQTCGACCCNAADNEAAGVRLWVEVDAEERLLRQRKIKDRHIVRDADGLAHLRMDDQGRSTALRGRLGRDVRCSIYEVRPRACRRVQPGDPDCERARLERGIG